MKYIVKENGFKYDVYMVNEKTGQMTYDTSFNIKEKAEQYAKNMSD